MGSPGAGRARTTFQAFLAFTAVCAAAVLCGCGQGNGGGPNPSPVRADLPAYDSCIVNTPMDPGYPGEPVITVNGRTVVNQPLGTPYADAGATANDPSEGDITPRIQTAGLGGVDTNTVGDYMIRYNVTNSKGLAGVEKARIVRVNAGRFSAQTARDIGTTAARMGYYEHLPVHYSDDPNQRFPLLVFIHGWGSARFLDPYTVQAPLSVIGGGNIAGLINGAYAPAAWDDSRPFIVLSPQKCVDALTYGVTASRMKVFLEYAINTYKVDTSRIYLGGHSQGSGDTWDFVTNYPNQLAAIFPIAGGYGTVSGCKLKETPAWAFAGELDSPVDQDQINTVASINACSPPERARVTILPGATHNSSDLAVITLSGLGQGMPPYDIYDQSIYDWLLAHQRTSPSPLGAALWAPRDSKEPGEDTFSAEAEEISRGERTTLRWRSPKASGCIASGDWAGARPASGAEVVAPAVEGMYYYLLTCSGAGVTRRVELTVGPAGAARGPRLPVETLDSYAGRYRLDAEPEILRLVGSEIVVRREGSRLVAEGNGRTLELTARSENEFHAAWQALVVRFLGDGKPHCPEISIAISGQVVAHARRVD